MSWTKGSQELSTRRDSFTLGMEANYLLWLLEDERTFAQAFADNLTAVIVGYGQVNASKIDDSRNCTMIAEKGQYQVTAKKDQTAQRIHCIDVLSCSGKTDGDVLFEFAPKIKRHYQD